MNKYVPNIYQKDIFSINYKKLKNDGIKVLLYDFDNTIIEKGNYEVSDKLISLFEKLKDDFIIYVVSNSVNTKKLNEVCKKLNIPYINKARKPFKAGYNKLSLEGIDNSSVAMIGDQIVTDVVGAFRMGYVSVFIDPIAHKELIFTKLNRLMESHLLKKYNIKRGNYYD